MSTLDKVAYKPLGMMPSSSLELDEGEDDQQFDNSRTSNFQRFRYHGAANLAGYGFQQFRVFLYILVIILFLIFLAQFATNEQPKPQHLSAAKLRSMPTTQFTRHPDKDQDQDQSASSPRFVPQSVGGKPEYYSYLASVLRDRNQRNVTHEQIDDFTMTANNMQFSESSTVNRWWQPNKRDKYVTITNYIRAMKSFNYNASITLTTQATTEFMYHTLELCKRWDGPISVAIFCPGEEMKVSLTLIKYMRQCLPSPLSACIKDKVTWHLVYNLEHGPDSNTLSYPSKYLDNENFPLFANQDLCPKFSGPEPSDSIRQFEQKLKSVNNLSATNYRQRHNLLYPINVVRNTARLAATTKYVLASDIELYPSINLVPLFMNYVTNHEVKERTIFTLPIFEVKSNVTAPKTKRELVSMFERGDAVFFHKWVCDWCQNFPNRLDWLRTDKFGYENHHEESNEVAIFERTQRDKSRNSWEPIFIGTNEDPLYDDRLTWEGRRDKMGQMYEMCLLDYELFVLGNAFIVHTPGIKHIDEEDNKSRHKFMISNNAIYDKTVKKLQEQYANSSTINKC